MAAQSTRRRKNVPSSIFHLPSSLFFLFFVASCLRGSQVLAQSAPIPRSSGSRSSSPTGSRSTCSPPTRMLAKPIQMNFDPAGPALGRQLRGLSADQARPDGQRQGPRPRRHRRRRQGRQDDRLRRRPADPHRRRAGRRRGLRRQQHRAAPPQGHRRRRQGRPPPRRPLGLRHRGHPPHPPHLPLGARRACSTSTSRSTSTATSRRPTASARLGGGGIWQFRPETMQLDVFIRGLVNPWGHHFDRWGQSFATDGAGGEGINYCLPGAYYFTAPDAVRILPGPQPRQPEVLRAGGRQRPAPARRLAGEPAHQRLPRQPRLPVRDLATTARGSPRASRPS